MGTTIPGGRYFTSDGRLVDANGRPIKETPPEAAAVKPKAAARKRTTKKKEKEE